MSRNKGPAIKSPILPFLFFLAHGFVCVGEPTASEKLKDDDIW